MTGPNSRQQRGCAGSERDGGENTTHSSMQKLCNAHTTDVPYIGPASGISFFDK